ncbi:uncharacterized protein L3040_009540 [Drepanopeziza brunnea f. sp. 'multigermtubi']|uniref:uncharacterized protein n=1 Tax=Drepanopeziza brunnea f. sp. 'multigermtubi' TaxID=698441 RepID=UPI00239772E7|nr:hypothetical protein L3040_009540 [Drepanopeziza brunnea f. sp. 'multigermtubi']
MPTENSITRLLFAILSQKCLKDIDWNKVARDPLLCQEITNGHAARMRYSRFKKQMDAASGIVPAPSTPRKPRKSRVEKNRSPPKKESPKQLKHFRDEERGTKRERDAGSEERSDRAGTTESDVDGSLGLDSSPGMALGLGTGAMELSMELDMGMDMGMGMGMGMGMEMGMGDMPTTVKRERKPSYATLHLHGQLQQQISHHPQQHHHHHPSSSSVSNPNANSTLPNTPPRMCIEQSPSRRGSFAPAGDMADGLLTGFGHGIPGGASATTTLHEQLGPAGNMYEPLILGSGAAYNGHVAPGPETYVVDLQTAGAAAAHGGPYGMPAHAYDGFGWAGSYEGGSE